MLKARDIMQTRIITVTPDTDITRAGKILLENHINGVPVVDDRGDLKGILCQSDLIFQQKEMPAPRSSPFWIPFSRCSPQKSWMTNFKSLPLPLWPRPWSKM